MLKAPPFALAHRAALLTFLLALLLAAPASAQVTTAAGQTATGAFYVAAVPDGWQPGDGLVIWNHGFDLDPIGPDVDLGPLVDLQLSQGFAVLASSYSQVGWAVFQVVDDLEQAVDAFEQRFGVPGSVYVTGASLGGIVTVLAIEQAELGNVVGALPICGVLGGSRTWDGGFDFRMVYDAVCSEVPGANIPGGPTGLPFPPDPNFGPDQIVGAADVCFGLFAGPAGRSAEQQARLDSFLNVTQIPESFIAVDLPFVTLGLADLIFDPNKLNFGQGVGNATTVYGDAEIDANIQRVPFDPAARQLLVDNYTPTGRVGDVKIVGLHTDKDGLIVYEHSTDYAGIVPAQNITMGIVVEETPTHCGFTAAETAGAWESLRAWVAGAPQPPVAQLQATCEAIAAGGLAAGPCRIDPDFVPQDLNVRIRPRQVCAPDDQTLCLNGGRFQVRSEWRDFDDNVGVGRVIPQTDDSGSFYFFGPENIELIVKALDGRQNNGNFWLFYGALSNVEYTITVVDTETGLSRTYFNPLGNFASVGDTSAF
ncbi:MAG: hypothetical protein AAF725_06945 [Acidobacteriota bacterium]